jgi:hypothetical protein
MPASSPAGVVLDTSADKRIILLRQPLACYCSNDSNIEEAH